MALMQPGDTFMGLNLAAGGHLTHGSPVNLSGQMVQAGALRRAPRRPAASTWRRSSGWRSEHRPKVIIAGGSAYPRIIDFRRFREIADEVGAYLMVDMAHFAGLVAGGVHPSPFPHAHVVTTTTHKTLRGPRGGVILTNDEELAKKINSAVFPGLQGGPLMHVIAAKAVAFGEALRPSFKLYAKNVVENAKALAETLKSSGLDIVSGGTDTHLMLVDLRPKRLTGKVAEAALGRAHITCNKNGIPFDPEKPTVTSGIRLGTPACTTRGFGIAEFRQVGEMIAEVLDVLSQKGAEEDAAAEAACARRSGAWSTASRSTERLGAGACAVRAARASIPRSRIPGRPRIPRSSAAAASAWPAISASPPSSACSCASWSSSSATAAACRSTATSCCVRCRSRCASGRSSPSAIDQMVSKIVRELESLGESEVTSETIGETVMAHLRDLDDVAYVRFASVYRNFREAKDFEAVLGELSATRTGTPPAPSRK